MEKKRKAEEKRQRRLDRKNAVAEQGSLEPAGEGESEHSDETSQTQGEESE